jgi:hypothetical protein
MGRIVEDHRSTFIGGLMPRARTAATDQLFKIVIARPGEVHPEGVVENVVEGSPEHFAQVGRLAAMGATTVQKIFAANPAQAPKSVALEFGITVGGEAGIPLVTKGKIDANFAVTITWERP